MRNVGTQSGTWSRGGICDPHKEQACVIRSQLEKGKGYLHEVGQAEVGECAKWSAREGSEIYQVRWGVTSWITNMRSVGGSQRNEEKRGRLGSSGEDGSEKLS